MITLCTIFAACVAIANAVNIRDHRPTSPGARWFQARAGWLRDHHRGT